LKSSKRRQVESHSDYERRERERNRPRFEQPNYDRLRIYSVLRRGGIPLVVFIDILCGSYRLSSFKKQKHTFSHAHLPHLSFPSLMSLPFITISFLFPPFPSQSSAARVPSCSSSMRTSHKPLVALLMSYSPSLLIYELEHFSQFSAARIFSCPSSPSFLSFAHVLLPFLFFKKQSFFPVLSLCPVPHMRSRTSWRGSWQQLQRVVLFGAVSQLLNPRTELIDGIIARLHAYRFVMIRDTPTSRDHGFATSERSTVKVYSSQTYSYFIRLAEGRG
jgi:hypothetical protein